MKKAPTRKERTKLLLRNHKEKMLKLSSHIEVIEDRYITDNVYTTFLPKTVGDIEYKSKLKYY